MSRAIHGKSYEALKVFRKKPAALAVYWIYVSRMNNEGVAWPALPRLAKETGWNKNTCHAARNHLIDLGALERVDDYVQPEWRKLSAQALTRKRNFDKSEYYRPTGYIMVGSRRMPMLYNGADEQTSLEEQSSDVPQERTSADTGHPPALDIRSGGNELSTTVVQEQKEAANAAPLEKPVEKPKQQRKSKQPATPKPVTLRSEGKPYPLYDTVERLIWRTEYDDAAPRLWDDPIGGIAKWLNGDIGKWQKKDYGYISKPAEPRHVEMFVKWYNTAKKGAELPRQFAKFVGYWREWGTAMRAKQAAVEIVQEPEPSKDDIAETLDFIRSLKGGNKDKGAA
jgi:hypothetical protein